MTLTTAQVAKELQVSESHVRRLCRERRLHAIRVANSWRIPAESFRKFQGLPPLERPDPVTYEVTG